ncbi:MAG: hypothetical protein J6K04_02010 [Lachnospiraceae bacterium]|nr:hypothetical protein [Lachnospiraceae bacterium]MBP3567916.1 hypothetical protein [Lachnospiraceae bacterium]
MTTEKELANAIERNENEIVIEGDLSNKVIRIKATGAVAWGACIIGLGAVVALGIATAGSGGTATLITLPAMGAALMTTAPVAVASMGLPAAVSAVGIAMAGGGCGVLNKLRDYKLVKVSKDKVILYRK